MIGKLEGVQDDSSNHWTVEKVEFPLGHSGLWLVWYQSQLVFYLPSRSDLIITAYTNDEGEGCKRRSLQVLGLISLECILEINLLKV